jgi:CRISP-associated protein Cas1
MNLVITTFGAYLHRKGEMFEIQVEKIKKEVAARKVRSILISTGASLSTDAIKLAIENNIDIVFLDKFGQPYGRVWHGRPASTTAIRRAQLRIADEAAGVALATSWIVRKLDNQLEFLENTRKKRTRLSAALTEKISALRTLREKLQALDGDLEELRGSIMGLEGKAGAIYWQAVNLLLTPQYQFKERSRNPATDAFNCFLNYAYGVLYSVVERGCVLAGLDPYVGFIHTDNYNKKSLVFDLIECYRIWADETVVGLFAARAVKKEMFRELENGLLLDKPGKIALMERFDVFLDEKIRYRNRNVMRREIVQLDCHRIANALIDKEEDDEANTNIGVDDL